MRRFISGFTLLELAVVLVIVGLMAGFILKATSGGEDNCYEKTRVQLADIQVALEGYVRSNNRYPKPSRVDYGSNNVDFGKEASSGLTSTGGAVIGSLPFATLGLNATYAADCWGSKFTYVVTDALTSSNPATGYPSGTPGNLTLKNATLAAPTTLSSSAAFVVVSHGADKRGATPLTSSDTTARHCDGEAGTKIDKENCDVGPAANLNFFDGTFNNSDVDATYYDDLIIYGGKGTVIADCEPTTVMWMTDCGKVMTSVLANGESALAQTSTEPPSTAGYAGSADIRCSGGTFTTSNATCASGGSACGNPTDCDASGMGAIRGGNCGGCNPDGAIVETVGAGCHRYQCSGGTWNDLGPPAMGYCQMSALCE